MNKNQTETSAFYDSYWPNNIPNIDKTREYLSNLIKRKNYMFALDAGCGSGVCSTVLSEFAKRVTAVDISKECVNTARALAKSRNISNIEFIQESILSLPFTDNSFDLVFSWGVIHHTDNPDKAISELIRVLAPGGQIYIALYWKTVFTPIHEAVRGLCVAFSKNKFFKSVFIRALTGIIALADIFLRKNKDHRDDNTFIESQVEDWFFVPVKFLTTPDEIKKLFAAHGIQFELAAAKTGRFKTSSNFVVCGTKPK